MKYCKLSLAILVVLILCSVELFGNFSILDYYKSKEIPIKRLPNCLLIGAKKAGTRALLTFLGLHPDIVVANSEIHFFDQHYDKGLEWYKDQLPETLSHQIGMEKSPAYFHTEHVPWRVHVVKPIMKLLLIVRDPTERVISDYTQGQWKLWKRGILNESAEDSPPKKVFSSHVSISKYSDHLWKWYKWFPRQQVHIISGESFSEENPYLELKKIEDFLGVETFFTEQMFYYNSTKKFFCYRQGEAKKCLGDTKGREHLTIDKDTIHKMRKLFVKYNRELYEMTGQNFSWPEK